MILLATTGFCTLAYIDSKGLKVDTFEDVQRQIAHGVG
jgi:hypothetical protein